MANRYATKAGNWSDVTVWDGGTTLPGSGDDVYSNNFTVTINQNVTVLSLRNGAATGITAGGGFSVTAGGYTISANIIATAGTTCVGVSAAAGNTLTFVGSATAGTSGHGISVTGACNINLIGDLTAGSSSTGSGLLITTGANGTYSITGNVYGGGSSGAGLGVGGTSAATITFTGTAVAGSVGPAVNLSSNGTASVNHVGAAYASSTAPAIFGNSISNYVTTTGPLVASDGTGGNAAGAGVAACVAYRWYPADTTLSTFRMTMRGATATGSPLQRPARDLYLTDAYAATYPAASNVRSGTTYGAGNSLTGTCAVPGASSVVVGVPVDNTTGTAAVTAASIRSALGLASANLDTQLAAIPTTAAPTASAVASAVWAALTSGLTTANSIGALLVANINATISSRSTYDGSDTSGTTTLLSRLTSGRASAIDNLDATVSSRLAASGYTAPPSASTVATAVWAAASRTLTTAIDNSATVAAAVWAYASGRNVDRVTLTDTATTLTNAPTVPSVAQITAGVWGQAPGSMPANGIGAQLAANVDAAVSSRLAASAYTVPPTTGAIRTELSVELARIDAAISTRSTYSGADTAGTTTLLGRLTSGRASNLDLIDVASSSRLAASAYTTPPTAAEIAAEVRSGIPEIEHLDANVSAVAGQVWEHSPDRTITGGTVDNLTEAPPTAAEISDAVKTGVREELAPELARAANMATTQEVAEIVEGALSS